MLFQHLWDWNNMITVLFQPPCVHWVVAIFKYTVETSKSVRILWYAPLCGRCKSHSLAHILLFLAFCVFLVRLFCSLDNLTVIEAPLKAATRRKSVLFLIKKYQGNWFRFVKHVLIHTFFLTLSLPLSLFLTLSLFLSLSLFFFLSLSLSFSFSPLFPNHFGKPTKKG